MRKSFTAADISASTGTSNAASMKKFIRGRMSPKLKSVSRDSLYQFDTLEAYQLLRRLMLEDGTTDKQFGAYTKYMDVLKGFR